MADNNISTSTIKEIQQGWFTETETLWPGQKFSLALEGFSNTSILYNNNSGFQSVLVFKSAQYGNVLVLDGVIQLTERDEFAYHEMMVHIPLNAHKNPKRVLIVGGGDGGILREVCKHDTVEEIVLVEIDAMVIEVSRKYLKTALDECFQDPRLTIVQADAADFLASHEPNYYDVIVGDTSDPVGPAESLFQPEYYEAMYAALKDQGIVCMQAECFWIHLDLISDVHACVSEIFDSAEYAATMVPTYPCGQIGFMLARRNDSAATSTKRTTCSYAVRRPATLLRNLKWYSPELHEAAFVLPPFVLRQLGVEHQVLTNNGSFNHGSRSYRDDDDDDDYMDGEQRKCFFDGIARFCRNLIGFTTPDALDDMHVPSMRSTDGDTNGDIKDGEEVNDEPK